MSYLDELNGPQKEAASHTEGPLLIVAGAGAGKTKTLTYRIFNLIKNGISPYNILAVTFTNKAAEEMRDRVASLIQKEKIGESPFFINERPFIGTFHALGIEILRKNADKLGVRKHFGIANRTTSLSLIKEALGNSGYDPKQYDPKTTLNIISRNKGELVSPQTYVEVSGGSYYAQVVSRTWEEYEKLLKKESVFDFDDLLTKTVFLLENNPDVLDYYKKRWTHVHIDEYQDTNKAQYMLSRLLVGEKQNICVVGDSDQNIYSWRGANIENILRFEKDYKDVRIIFLEQNYRSTKRILEAAQAVIEKNTLRQDKKLFTENSTGEKLALFSGSNENEEAFFVAHKTQELISAGVSPNEIAVLYRANFQSRVLEEAFLSFSLPYKILGTRFFERKEIQDILAYITLALNRDSTSSLKRIINTPRRGIGKVTLLKLLAGKEDELPEKTREKISSFFSLLDEIKSSIEKNKPSDVIKWLTKKIGLDIELMKEGEEGKERLENIKELVSLATRYDDLPLEEGILKLLEDALLAAEQDALKKKEGAKPSVSLMTVHASKGLEFPYVFIVGLEDGLFPHESFDDAGDSDERSEEERRLFYVAITRGGKKVFLTLARTRMIYGSREMQSPSQFIYDIPEEILEKEGVFDAFEGGGLLDEDVIF